MLLSLPGTAGRWEACGDVVPAPVWDRGVEKAQVCKAGGGTQELLGLTVVPCREDILSSVWLRMMDPGDPTAVESRPALEWSMVSNSSGL